MNQKIEYDKDPNYEWVQTGYGNGWGSFKRVKKGEPAPEPDRELCPKCGADISHQLPISE